jgi:hypothetical protein
MVVVVPYNVVNNILSAEHVVDVSPTSMTWPLFISQMSLSIDALELLDSLLDWLDPCPDLETESETDLDTTDIVPFEEPDSLCERPTSAWQTHFSNDVAKGPR